MAGIARCEMTHTEGECQLVSRPQECLEGLEAQEAWRELRERHRDAPGYYELLASLMA